MKRFLILILGFVTIITIVISCTPQETKTAAAVSFSNDSLIKKGAYLVSIMGCNDCHTPKKMTDRGPVLDMDRLLSGHPATMPIMPFDTATSHNWALFNMTGTAVVGPWGASFSANLTSDETGIGTWTEAQFKKAITEGKSKGCEGTRTLLPPKPWENYKDIKDDDVKALFAYLKSTKPVQNIVPNPILPTMLAQYTR